MVRVLSHPARPGWRGGVFRGALVAGALAASADVSGAQQAPPAPEPTPRVRSVYVPNVYAAGDITPGAQLAICAAGEGAVAALAIHKSLVPEMRKLAKRPKLATPMDGREQERRDAPAAATSAAAAR